MYCSSWHSDIFGKDAHKRSWETIAKFLEDNLAMFSGKSSDAESTVLPQLRQWIKRMVSEHASTNDGYDIVLMLNLPMAGVVSAAQRSFFINCITNVLADRPNNAICFVVHGNRAGHKDARPAS